MSLSGTPVYQPTAQGTLGLEVNSANLQNGDMVAGAYTINGTYSSTLTADEDGDYNRRDFTPSVSGTASASASSFLVRMRRTPLWNVSGSLDDTSGVSSGGPTLPLLFGRGSLMARSGSNGQLSVASGITVRATAIADARPAKSVGPLYSTSSGTLTAVPQLAPFAIKNDLWQQSSGTLTVNLPNPEVLSLAQTFSTSLTAIGQPLATGGVACRGIGDCLRADLRRFLKPACHDHWLRLRPVEL